MKKSEKATYPTPLIVSSITKLVLYAILLLLGRRLAKRQS